MGVQAPPRPPTAKTQPDHAVSDVIMPDSRIHQDGPQEDMPCRADRMAVDVRTRSLVHGELVPAVVQLLAVPGLRRGRRLKDDPPLPFVWQHRDLPV